ncbi:MFS transporter [Phenylobacterium sp.]|jgi:MFS family permease|uniref:MFS transporter n=1 Tax=Phenylobacterium sp. TaxID=1871053 RepID=UPI0037CC8DA4
MSVVEANDPGSTDELSVPPTGFAAYLFTQGAWFLAFGLQMVLFPYLVRVLLQEDEIRFGLAQMSMQLPTVLLILLGGFVADRTDTRRTVLIGCGLCALSFLGLGVFVAGGHLTYATLIIYALVIGTIGAFATPARDALLSRVAPGGVHQAVGFASLAQFGGQILGMAVATAAPILGLPALLFGQAALMAAAAGAATRIKPRPAGPPRIRDGSVLGFMASEIGGGFRAAMASPVIAPVVICATGMGMCFMGAFAVLLPLIVQSYFPPDLVGPARAQIATALGVFSLTFWVGSMLSATAMIRFGHIRRKGRVYLASLFTGATVLVFCSIPMPFWLLCGLNFVWGLGGGVAMTLGRSLVQQYAPADKVARVLSIFTLGTMGGAPAGAVLYGVLAHAIGPHAAILIPGVGMLIIVSAVTAYSQLGRLDEARPAIC